MQYNMKSTQIQSQHFDIELYLQQLCKRQPIYDEAQQEKYQIDFLALEKDLTKIQSVQERTCEQIVEFVDQHRERFIQINEQLDQIESKVRRSENILKLMGSRIDDYKSEYYLTESKIQKCINEYEFKLLKNQVLELAKGQAQFLTNFNKQFQHITSKRIETLSYSDKYLISRFTYKMNFLKSLYSHHIVKELVLQALDISQIVTHLQEQLELYLSQQLSRVQQFSNSSVEAERTKINDSLDLIKAWYINIGKKQQYYKVIQKNTIEKQMQAGQKLLIANKTSLLSGKDPHIMENVFTKILISVAACPHNHPQQRLKSIIFTFFKKEELKFLYTYAMPIFPLAYRSYFAAIQKSGVEEWLKKYMQEHNGWNLKMWMQVRQKNIFDRSNNDSDMLKWIDIVFKSSCMLPGSLPQFTKLIFKIINRYLNRIVNTELVASSFNKLIEQSSTVPLALQQKITEVNTSCKELAQRAGRSLRAQFQKTIQQILVKNLHNICSSCQSCLQSTKSFVSKIIKKDKEFLQTNTINKEQNIFKPLNAFLKNNAEMEAKSVSYIKNFVTKALIKYYDTHYVPQIFSYAKDHLISDQVSLVMEVIGRQRTIVFKVDQQN